MTIEIKDAVTTNLTSAIGETLTKETIEEGEDFVILHTVAVTGRKKNGILIVDRMMPCLS